jgi:hypothetical protein
MKASSFFTCVSEPNNIDAGVPFISRQPKHCILFNDSIIL